jgi:hypothetical protein
VEVEEQSNKRQKTAEKRNEVEVAEQSNKHQKTADKGMYIIFHTYYFYYFLNICNMTNKIFIYCYKVSSTENILNRIYLQNSRILLKLKEIEERLSKFENNNTDNTRTDQDFVKVRICYKIA